MEKTRVLVRFGLFEFDAESGELRKQGRKIRLSDQPTQILALLLERPGEVVTRDAVRQRLWPADTFVDFDAGLNSATKKLRDALGDPAENPQFVETLPRRGYRFIAPVTVTPIDPLPEAARAESETTPSRIRYAWIAGGVALVATVALVVVTGRGWWPRAGAAPDRIESLAVLPFENLTGDTGRDHLADSLTNALTTSLAQAGGFHVVSSTSAAQYRSTNRSLPAIARELNVDAVLEGSIATSGQDVRVTAQLIDAGTDRHIWARTYEGEPGKVLEMHREMARVIAVALQNRFTPSSPATQGNQALAVNAEANDAYLKGTLDMGRQTPEGFRSAVAYFEQAVAREPDFAQAYVVMAQAQMQLLFGGPLSPREVVPKAEAAVRRALQLDDTLAQAHATLGSILTNFYWKWDEGESEFRRARELAHRSSDTRTGGGGVESLIRAGRVQDAIAEAEASSNRDPRSFSAHMNLASAYRAAGQHDRAIERYRRAQEIDPASTRGRFQLGITFLTMGRMDDAIGELEAAVAQSRKNPRFQAYLGYAYAAAVRRVDALKMLAELDARAREQYVSSFGIALIYDALGQGEQALAALERAHQDRAVEFAQMAQYPPFKTIAPEPRYKSVMQSIGLPR